MRRKEQGPWILMTFWGKDCLNISMKNVWYPHFYVSFCIEFNCMFFVFTRLLNCFNGEGFHFSWGCPKRKIFARSFIFHQSTSCQNSSWVWGTNWMQCNFLSFESNSGLNGHNIIRLNPDVKAWNNHSIWCWNGYSLILSDSIWTLTNVLLYFTLTVLSLNQTSKVFRLFVKQLFAL